MKNNKNNKKNKKKNIKYVELVPCLKNDVYLDEETNSLLKLNNSKIQKILRKAKVNIPEKTTLVLDEKTRLIVENINGVNTLGEIVNILGETFPSEDELLLDKVIYILGLLENYYKMIKFI